VSRVVLEHPYPTDVLRDRSEPVRLKRYQEGFVRFNMTWPAGAPLFVVDRIGWLHEFGWTRGASA
jgi:hypothetical protein